MDDATQIVGNGFLMPGPKPVKKLESVNPYEATQILGAKNDMFDATVVLKPPSFKQIKEESES